MKKLPYKLVIFGAFFVLFGTALILMNTGVVPTIIDLWPVALLFFGLIILYGVFAGGAYKAYMLPGFFFTLAGLILVILRAVQPYIEIPRIWPLFMLLIGLSMLPYLRIVQPKRRVALAVPAAGIIVLSLVFMLFSFDIIRISFIDFVKVWWPSLFVILGLFLVYEEFKKKK